MKRTTDNILTVMKILSWVVLCGLIAKAGAILFTYVLTISNPEGSKNLYNGFNLYSLRQYSFWLYTQTVSLFVAIPLLGAYTASVVIKVLSKIRLANPFTIDISKKLQKISYLILGIWVLVMLYNLNMKWVVKTIPGLEENLISGDFILMGGVVFIFSQIFKKGVELQSENELTV